ncbi:MAG: hypothetical protein ACOX8X_07065 [Methanomethylophilus sp.]|jgi:hypothetical protein
MDIDNYAPKKPAGPSIIPLVWTALAVGIVSIILAFVNGIAAAVFGAIGLFLGGYTMARAMKHVQAGIITMKYVWIAGIGLILSVIGFMAGWIDLVG